MHNIVLQMSLKHGVKFEPKKILCSNSILHYGMVTNKQTTKFVICFFCLVTRTKLFVSCDLMFEEVITLEVGKKVMLGIGEVQKGTNQSQNYCKGSSVNT
jgi:hypothetical protein